MSHSLERLLARLRQDQKADEIRSEFRHATVDHAMDRGLVAAELMDNILVYKLTEAGRRVAG